MLVHLGGELGRIQNLVLFVMFKAMALPDLLLNYHQRYSVFLSFISAFPMLGMFEDFFVP